jgi:guanylate kinase
VRRPLREGKVPLFIKDVKGTKTLTKALEGKVFSVFILPPSLAVLEERLRQRGGLSEKELQDRLQAAETEIAEAFHFSAILYNENIDKAVARLVYHLRRYL